MKTIVLILLLFPVLCFAQNEHSETVPNKPSTTACPTWNKKSKKSSKADYFQYLRTNKPKVDPNAASKDYSKIQSNPVTKKREDSTPIINQPPTQKENSDKVAMTKPEKTKKGFSLFSERPTTTNSSTEQKNVVPKSEEKIKTEEVAQEPKTNIISETEVKQNDERIQDSATASGKKVETKESGATEKTKLKRKLGFMLRKKTKVHRHSNSKCPSFK